MSNPRRRSKRDSPGRRLVRLCAEAEREVLMAAPFIKAGALRRLLEVIGKSVRVRCITRWRPEEIAAGVSDLAVWSLLRERSHASLGLCDDLHAKYYRADETCLVGSANLTAAALGWSNTPNLELLVSRPACAARLISFEHKLMRTCTNVDDSLVRRLEYLLRRLEETTPQKPMRISDPTEDTSSGEGRLLEEETLRRNEWLPTLRHPEDLLRFYHGETEALTSAACRAASRDLAALDLPPGLSENAFRLYVAWHLLQQPAVREVDTFLAKPRRFGAVRRFLREQPVASRPGFDATRVWQTLMRWMLFFLPERYEHSVQRYTEVVQRIEDKN